MFIEPWVCEICAEIFDNEIDLLAHQFNSPCETEIKEQLNEIDYHRMHPDGQSDAAEIWTNEDESAEIERQIVEDARR
jgi:hypothetical protein